MHSGRAGSWLAGAGEYDDHDGDGFARLDIGACELENATLVPGDVSGLLWVDKDTLQWNAEPSAGEYHVYRDDLSALGYDRFGSCRDDLDEATGVRTDKELLDAEPPLPGAGWLFIVSAEAAAEEGTLGFGSCAERSDFNPCP